MAGRPSVRLTFLVKMEIYFPASSSLSDVTMETGISGSCERPDEAQLVALGRALESIASAAHERHKSVVLRGNNKFHVGAPGIEPRLYAPEAHVLPLYYAPLRNLSLLYMMLGPDGLVILGSLLLDRLPGE
jgi:hypothetical protein